MTKRIDQRFFTNAVNLLPDVWSQWLLAAFDADAKVDIGRHPEFLLNPGQRQNQVPGAGVGRTQTLNRGPAFLYPLLHELKNLLQLWLDWRAGRQVLHGRVELHRGAQEALQQRVVEFLGN